MDSIPRRRFGRTEIAMPVFSCGGMRFQFRWQDQPFHTIPSDAQRNLEATVRRAVDLGICHIETARGYGTSERQLGRVLSALPRDRLILQTKISPKAEPREFERDFEDSLGRLGVDHVELLALHGINDATVLDWALRQGGCFEVAQRLREKGRCRFVGFSTHGDLETILSAIRFGEARVGAGFDYVNLHWYFVFQRNWAAIEEATRRDMGVFIISPTDKGGRLHAPPAKLRDLCAPLSPLQFNDLFCLAHPQVHTVSIGAARPSDFDEHVAVCERLEGAAALLAPIRARLAAAMERATGDANPEAVTVGLPRWQDTPNRYNLPVILWLRNLAVGWDLVDYAKWRYNMLSDSGHWFPGNRPRTVDEIPRAGLERALRGHPRTAEILNLLEDAVRRLAGEDQARLSRGGA